MVGLWGEEFNSGSFSRRLRCGIEGANESVNEGGNKGRGGNGEDPCPYDAAGHAPAHGRKTVDGADADNAAGNSVRGANGDAEDGGHQQGKGGGALGTEPTDGFEFGDLGAHGTHNAPAAEVGAQGDHDV